MRYQDLPLKETLKLHGTTTINRVEILGDSRAIVYLEGGYVLMVDALLQEG